MQNDMRLDLELLSVYLLVVTTTSTIDVHIVK